MPITTTGPYCYGFRTSESTAAPWPTTVKSEHLVEQRIHNILHFPPDVPARAANALALGLLWPRTGPAHPTDMGLSGTFAVQGRIARRF